jgi:hypothetical protein
MTITTMTRQMIRAATPAELAEAMVGDGDECPETGLPIAIDICGEQIPVAEGHDVYERITAVRRAIQRVLEDLGRP